MAKRVRIYNLVQVDVFTKRALEGNSLAVFTDGRGLSTAQMQAIAREMNLSETTFILPRKPAEERKKGTRVRIFTVQEELPFAGHPTLGTAYVLRTASSAAKVELELNVGKIPVSFRKDGFGEMRQRDPEFGAVHAREEVARATGLAADEIDDELPIQTVSTGLVFTIVPVRKLATMQELRIDVARAGEYLQSSGGKFFYFVSRETAERTSRLHARMIFYNGEDPATGSAAGCTAAWMVAHGVAKSGESAVIEQGLEMKRPSYITVRAEKTGSKVTNVHVGGHVVEVMRGQVFL